MSIHTDAPANEKLTKFFDYFVEQWLENEDIPVAFWNCHNKRHRTNNAVEGWNRKINSYVERPHPRIKNLVECLKKEGENCDHLFKRMELSLEGRKRKKCYIKLDERISRASRTYEETGDATQFLRRLAYSKAKLIFLLFPSRRNIITYLLSLKDLPPLDALWVFRHVFFLIHSGQIMFCILFSSVYHLRLFLEC